MREDADVDCSDLKAPAFGKQNLVAIAKGSHLFPSRTQKLSPSALKILGGRLPGKRGRCQFCFPFLDMNQWLHGQAVKTPPFHGGNSSSILDGVTIKNSRADVLLFLFSNIVPALT
jgi:hypothetical protein